MELAKKYTALQKKNGVLHHDATLSKDECRYRGGSCDLLGQHIGEWILVSLQLIRFPSILCGILYQTTQLV
jgi:hypothetical protein